MGGGVDEITLANPRRRLPQPCFGRRPAHRCDEISRLCKRAEAREKRRCTLAAAEPKGDREWSTEGLHERLPFSLRTHRVALAAVVEAEEPLAVARLTEPDLLRLASGGELALGLIRALGGEACGHHFEPAAALPLLPHHPQLLTRSVEDRRCSVQCGRTRGELLIKQVKDTCGACGGYTYTPLRATVRDGRAETDASERVL